MALIIAVYVIFMGYFLGLGADDYMASLKEDCENKLGDFKNMVCTIDPEKLKIDYLQFESDIHFHHMDIEKDAFGLNANYPGSIFHRESVKTSTETINNKTSIAVIAHENGVDAFKVSYWQEDNGVWTPAHLINQSDICLNHAICFLEQKPITFVIHELYDEFKINLKGTMNQNDQSISIKRVDDNTVHFTISSDGIMPENELKHNRLAWNPLHVMYEDTDFESCDQGFGYEKLILDTIKQEYEGKKSDSLVLSDSIDLGVGINYYKKCGMITK